MSITSSPSDYSLSGAPDYSAGLGFYTDYIQVADLLQVPRFDTSSTYPTRAQVGNIIKRVEGMVDDKLKRSYRPIVTKKEIHNFEYTNRPGMTLYGGYVGFIQLRQMKIQKVISLQVWSGSGYKEIASAQSKIKLLENYRDMHSIILELPNSGVSFEMVAENNVGSLGNDEFCTTFGIKTTATDIVSLVNEEFPPTHRYTNAASNKSLTSSSLSISDFFFAQKEEGDGGSILISSLLSGDDGSDCVIKATIQQSSTTTNSSTSLTVADSSKLAVGMVVTGTGITGTVTIASISNSTTVILDNPASASGTNTLTFTTTDSIPTVCTLSAFTDKEDMQRTGDYWLLGEEGRIFFLQDYPFHTRNSVFVSYVAGNNRVPAAVHEAATKLAAAEIIRHDDQSILITETGANISTKEKYDILRKEAMDILSGKTDIVYFID
tara:strand:+ start:158 stop:1465 length:1308 start_codon:yes stop_codon:yes gene_type:complete